MTTATGKVGLVTGANRGIGLEVCRQLAKAGMRVIGTSRDAGTGKLAGDQLRAEGLGVSFETLDVGDEASVAALGSRLARKGERLDAIVNNAGMSMKGFDGTVAELTCRVNFLGPLRVTDATAPLLRDGARVVMVSSGLGKVSILSPALQKRFLDPAHERDALLALVEEFVRDVRDGRHEARGWPSSAYGVSKVALNSLARILARELEPRRILVNAVSPGWVRTDMGGAGAPRSVVVGAKGIVWAALLPEGGPTGKFFEDERPVPW